MNESSEQFSNVVTFLSFSNQYFSNSYSVISVSEIDFIISKVFESHCRNKLKVVMAKYLELIIVCDGGVSEEFRILFNCLTPSTSQWKNVTHVLKDHSTDEGYQGYIEDKT